MLNRIKLYFSLPKQDRHFSKWLSQNTHLLPRLETMTAHEVIILSDYTDKEIEKYGVSLLYSLTKDLALKPHLLSLLNLKTIKTLADSVIIYQKKEYGMAQHSYAYVNSIVANEWHKIFNKNDK